jgi:hypothetical protein
MHFQETRRLMHADKLWFWKNAFPETHCLTYADKLWSWTNAFPGDTPSSICRKIMVVDKCSSRDTPSNICRQIMANWPWTNAFSETYRLTYADKLWSWKNAFPEDTPSTICINIMVVGECISGRYTVPHMRSNYGCGKMHFQETPRPTHADKLWLWLCIPGETPSNTRGQIMVVDECISKRHADLTHADKLVSVSSETKLSFYPSKGKMGQKPV